MWGIAVWSLGNMIYDMGYNSYRNPYPAPAVVYIRASASRRCQVHHHLSRSRSTVTAAANPPGDDEQAAQLAETKSDEALERSRVAFKQGDYMTAMKAVDEAIAHTPGDVTLHEYRALVLFALGRYADAAGVLNPVLASGPGWGWDTMVEFYDSSPPTTASSASSKPTSKARRTSADAHFLLGYHYLVCGHMESPTNSLPKLWNCNPPTPSPANSATSPRARCPRRRGRKAAPPKPDADPRSRDKLVGTWVSDRGAGRQDHLQDEGDGNFTWNYSATEIRKLESQGHLRLE